MQMLSVHHVMCLSAVMAGLYAREGKTKGHSYKCTSLKVDNPTAAAFCELMSASRYSGV